MIQDGRVTPDYDTADPQTPTAHLDTVHVGDIHGAWGTIRQHDTAPRRTWLTRLLRLFVIAGTGLVTKVVSLQLVPPESGRDFDGDPFHTDG